MALAVYSRTYYLVIIDRCVKFVCLFEKFQNYSKQKSIYKDELLYSVYLLKLPKIRKIIPRDCNNNFIKSTEIKVTSHPKHFNIVIS